jgi:hypothetical protein
MLSGGGREREEGPSGLTLATPVYLQQLHLIAGLDANQLSALSVLVTEAGLDCLWPIQSGSELVGGGLVLLCQNFRCLL